MREAIQVSIENIKSGGGPFGAVIVRSGEIIAKSERNKSPQKWSCNKMKN